VEIEDTVKDLTKEVTERLVKLMKYVVEHDLEVIIDAHEGFGFELLINLYYYADRFVIGDCEREFRKRFIELFSVRFLQFAEMCKKLGNIPEETIREDFAKKLIEVYYDWDIDEILNRIENRIETMLRVSGRRFR